MEPTEEEAPEGAVAVMDDIAALMRDPEPKPAPEPEHEEG